MTVVVDTSVVLSWIIPDEQTEETLAVLHRLADADLFAPTLIDAEILNGLVLMIRRKRLSLEDAEAARSDAVRLPIRRIGRTLGDASSLLALAQKHGLTAYDALFLDLALLHGAVLATHDRRLRAAAEAEGLAVLP